MAVWAIAWAGSKPVASLTDGVLAGKVGLLRTGFLLALPALIPVTVLVVLMISVFAVRAWKPRRRLWQEPGRVRFKSVKKWYGLAEFYLDSAPLRAIEATAEVSHGGRVADAAEPVSVGVG